MRSSNNRRSGRLLEFLLTVAIFLVVGLVYAKFFHHRHRAAGPDLNRYHCDGRTYCSQMSSCAEAKYFLTHCPNVKMDGDHDGIPCEQQLCGH